MPNRVALVGLVFILLFTNASANAQQRYYVTTNALQISPDGETIAVATVSGSLRIYDATTRNVICTLQASGDEISDAHKTEMFNDSS